LDRQFFADLIQIILISHQSVYVIGVMCACVSYSFVHQLVVAEKINKIENPDVTVPLCSCQFAVVI